MWPNPQFPADLVTFTKEILNGKLHFFVQCLLSTEMKKIIYKTKWNCLTTLKNFSNVSLMDLLEETIKAITLLSI